MRINTNSIARMGGFLYLSLFFLSILVILSITLLILLNDSLPDGINTELVDIIVSSALTIGLLALYYRTAKTQSSQEVALTEQAEALSKQVDTLSTQTDELAKQRDIMKRQQNLEEELHKLILDIDGYRTKDDNALQICVSNHGGGIARNIRIVSNVVLPNDGEELTYETKLNKKSDKGYLNEGNTVASQAKEVEMEAEVKFLKPSDSEEPESCTFTELTRFVSSSGISNISLTLLLRAEDQHGNMDEDVLYDVEGSIYSDMTLEEFLS